MSGRRVITRTQIGVFVGLGAGPAMLAARAPDWVGAALQWTAIFVFSAAILVRLAALAASVLPARPPPPWRDPWPRYAILAPL